MKTFITITIGIGVGLLWNYGWEGSIVGGIVAGYLSNKLNKN